MSSVIKSSSALVRTLTLFGALLGTLGVAAPGHARWIHPVAGMGERGTDAACFEGSSSVGGGLGFTIRNTCGTHQTFRYFQVAFPMDTSGSNKSVTMTGWVSTLTGSGFNCIISAVDGMGRAVSSVNLNLNSAGGSGWRGVVGTLPTVNAGNTVVARCLVSGAGSAMISGFTYAH